MWVVDKGEELLWTTVASEVECMIGIYVLGDEAWMVSIGSDDEDTKAFPRTNDIDREKEGMWSGILGTWSAVDSGIGGCTEIGVIEAGMHVEAWYS